MGRVLVVVGALLLAALLGACAVWLGKQLAAWLKGESDPPFALKVVLGTTAAFFVTVVALLGVWGAAEIVVHIGQTVGHK